MKTTQEMLKVMQSFVDGKKLEWRSSMFPEWQETENPSWEWSHLDYRIKQVSPLIIPWDAIKPEYKWAAKDADGKIHLYAVKPSKYVDTWGDGISQFDYFEIPDWLNTQDTDSIDWKDSLVERPSA